MPPTEPGLSQLRSARLHYEFVTVENAVVLWQLMRAPYLREYQDIPRPTLVQFRERVASRPPHFVRGAIGRFEWILRAGVEGEPIGWVSLRTHEKTPFCGELGYSILHNERKKGYASEAVGAAITGGFSTGVVDRISAYCLPENIGSRGVLQRVGLQEIRRIRRGAVVRGRPVDIVLYELDQIAWRRRPQVARKPRTERLS